MGAYVSRRVVEAAVTLWVLMSVVFLSVRVTGDPAAYLLGPEGGIAEYEQLKRDMGLDQSLIVQYTAFIANTLRGDFGSSLITGRPVRDMLLERLPATATLAASAFALIVLVGVPLGIFSAVKRDSPLDLFAKFFAVLGIAAPSFWVAILLILLFGAILGWLPTYGGGGLKNYIMPTFVLGWQGMAGMVRLARSSVLEVLQSDYVKYARSKGLTERMLIFRHALPNALIPLITFGGLSLAGLLNGSVIVEVVFGWPGVGLLTLQGISQRDYPLVQATVLIGGFFYIASAMLVDIVYGIANPKIRIRA